RIGGLTDAAIECVAAARERTFAGRANVNVSRDFHFESGFRLAYSHGNGRIAMKATKLIAVAMFAALALAIAGSTGAAGGHGSGHASSARAASHGAGHAGMGYRAGMRQGRFPGSYRYFPYYPYYGYGYG